MPAIIQQANIPGLFNVTILGPTPEVLTDLTVGQVDHLIATRGLVPA